MRCFGVVSSFALLTLGCDSSPGATDAAAADAAVVDAALPDAPEVDAAGVDPVWDCTETGVDVYTPPAGLRGFGPSERGVVVRCGADDPIAVADVRTRAAARGYTGPELTSGASVTRLTYRTERADGRGGFSSATLYLPDDGSGDHTLVIHVAEAAGMGDPCAPSRVPTAELERVLYVLLGRGHAVLVPDHLALGTPGTHAWLEPSEAAHAVLDGARAAMEAAPSGRLSGAVVVSGHSAGGHAALATQALQRTYAPEVELLGVSSIAPVWIDTNLLGLLLSQDAYRVDTNEGLDVLYAAAYFTGHSAAYDGDDRAYELIAPDRRDAVRTLYETACIGGAGGAPDLATGLAGAATTVGELFDPASRVSISRCAFIGDCDALGTVWRERSMADRPALDPAGAPVFIHLGTTDARVTPRSMACPIQTMLDAGVSVTTCVHDDADHAVVATDAAPFTADLVTALETASTPPACPDPTAPPSC